MTMQGGTIKDKALEKIGQKLFNARSETASEKPAFREAWQKRRCLVPATGFYEWNHRDGRNQPFHFTRPDRGLFCFAGSRIKHKTMLKKCSERTSHPKKPCVVKNKKCVSK